MKNDFLKYLILLIIGAVIGIGAYSLLKDEDKIQRHSESENKTLYTCGMHPEIIEEEPGTCPICGMNLTPIKNGNGTSNNSDGIIQIDGSVTQNMNIKIDEVKRGSLNSEIFTNGIITAADNREYAINLKVDGWIKNLKANYIGQKINKGDKLFEIYSPELLAAQEELVSALSTANKDKGNKLLKSAIEKLKLFDISQKEIDRIIETKKVKKYTPYYSFFNGTVLEKNIVEGKQIKRGTDLIKISDLRYLWAIADIYENEANLVSVGDSVIVNVNSINQKFNGVVSFIYPIIDENSKTIKVRINVENKNEKLKPNMFASVVLKGKTKNNQLMIPESAVLRIGRKNIVVESLGEGKFKSIELELGNYIDGMYQIKAGMQEGDKFVVSGQFLIDSESNLKSAVDMYSAAENDAETKNDSKLIREGVIDVESIDVNKDGKVFQDPMDWNVISDEDGRCPICNMFLKEVTINEAKENLKGNGFDYK